DEFADTVRLQFRRCNGEEVGRRAFPVEEQSNEAVSESRMEGKEVRKQCNAHAFLCKFCEHSCRVRRSRPAHLNGPMFASAMQFPIAERLSVHEANARVLGQLLWLLNLLVPRQIFLRSEEATREGTDPARQERGVRQAQLMS